MPHAQLRGHDRCRFIVGEPGATNPHDAYFYYCHANDLQAMRMGKWKLHFPHKYRTIVGTTPGSDGTPGPYIHPTTRLELYDLEADIGEGTNIASQYPEVVERMTVLAEEMRADLGDNLTKTKGTGQRPPGRVADKK